MTKLVKHKGTIAGKRGVAKFRSSAKATILWQGKLAMESRQIFGIAYWFAANEL